MSAGSRLASFSDPAAWSRLADADTTEAFGAAWLDLQCRLIGDVRAALVVLGPTDAGAYEVLTRWPEGASGGAALEAVAELSLQKRRGSVRQRAGSPELGDVHVDALAYPIVVGEALRGVVALEVPHESEARLSAVMRLMQWGCAWWHRRLGADIRTPRGLTTVLELLTSGLQEDRFLGAATTVVTELATHLRCDRVAFGTRERRRADVRALSHTATFNKKTGLIRDLAGAMDEAIDQQDVLVLPTVGEDVPRITRLHERLMDRHGSKAVCTVPLVRRGMAIGALTLERSDASPFLPDEVALCAQVGALLGPVLELKRREDRWVGVKLWESARGFVGDLLGPRHLALKASAVGLSAALAFLAFATGDYRVTAPAVLEGTVQRAVTAPQDGYVARADARAGDLVEAHQTLAALEDKDLRLEKIQWEGQREKLLREYSSALAQRERARVRILDAQIEQAEARIALLAEQLARTRITAPFTGVVVSGDLSQSLGAPVSRGEVLFEVAPLDSYRVILKVDERDISQLRIGQTGKLALSGLPGEPLEIQVNKITPVADAEQGQNLFRVESVLKGSPETLRPGMNGVAKVSIDERKLLWIWTHRLVYWLRLWWWSWWP